MASFLTKVLNKNYTSTTTSIMPNTSSNKSLSNISDFWITDITERVINYTHPKVTKISGLINSNDQLNLNLEE